MRMTVLASGSKGNSTVVASANTRLLIDAGLSCRELLKRMALAGWNGRKAGRGRARAAVCSKRRRSA